MGLWTKPFLGCDPNRKQLEAPVTSEDGTRSCHLRGGGGPGPGVGRGHRTGKAPVRGECKCVLCHGVPELGAHCPFGRPDPLCCPAAAPWRCGWAAGGVGAGQGRMEVTSAPEGWKAPWGPCPPLLNCPQAHGAGTPQKSPLSLPGLSVWAGRGLRWGCGQGRHSEGLCLLLQSFVPLG